MEIKVIKGLNQIGGCITSISSKNAKIIIDFGKDLDDDSKNIEIEGLTYGKSMYDAVFITHSHGDHIGLVNNINKDIPVYIEEKSLLIHNILCDFVRDDKIERNIEKFDIRREEVIKIKDILVTPLIVDHSSFNSCMFLIECEGKRILHTGDFRNHGRKGSLFLKTLQKLPKIDVLITEGTTLARLDKKYMSEYELEKEALKIIKEYDQVFVMQSSTNIDRTVSFCRATLKANKKFVMDVFTKALMDNLNNIVKFDNKNVFVWKPIRYNYKSEEFKKKYLDFEDSTKFLPNFVMQVKSSMLPDLKLLKKKGLIKKGCLVYSMWDGYIEKDDQVSKFIEEAKDMGIDFISLHTSGHASRRAMQLLDDTLKPEQVIVIHTEENELGKEVFKNYKKLEENEVVVL